MKKLTKIFLLVVVLVLSLVLATACETLENHTHTPASQWTSDGTNHWHNCTFDGCTEQLDKVACSGGTATIEEKATCSTCGNQYGELAEDNSPLAEKYEHITIAQACELAIAAGDTPTTTEYTIIGTIVEVKNSIYGEMTVSDTTGSIYVYGCEIAGTLYGDATDRPVKGDIVVLKGVLKAYNGTPEMSTQSNRAEILDFEHVKVEIDPSEYPSRTIAEARSAQKGYKLKLQGVVAAITYANGRIPSGIILVDDTSSIYVYSGDIAQQVEVGNKVEIAGSKTYWILETEQSAAQDHGYIGACQIESAVIVSNDNQTHEFDKTWVQETTVKQLLNTEFSENITSLVVKSTAIIKKAQNPGFVNYYIDDLDGATGTYVYTQCNGSDFGWLDEFDGKVCTVYYTALNAKSSASGCNWRLLPVHVEEIANFSFPAEDVPAFAIEYAVVDLFESGVFGADPAIELPNSYSNEIINADNVTLTYASSDTSVATVTTGADNTVLNLVGEGSCNITITATFGSYTATKTVSVELEKSEEIQTPTVAEIIATADGTEVTLRGIVMSSVVNQDGAFYICDSTGMIAVRATAEIAAQLKAGNEVVVKGIKKHHKKNDSATSYVGQIVIDDATVLANYYGEHDYETSYFITGKTIAELYELSPLDDHSTEVYVVEGKFVVENMGTYSKVTLQDATGANYLTLYSSGSGQYAWLNDYQGQVLTFEIAMCNWNGKTYYAACVISVTDADGNKIINTLNFAQ